MEHPTEFAIEQFVLNAPEISPLAYEISGHLERCATCNALAQEVRLFYEKASVRLENESRTEPVATRALITQRELHHRYASETLEPPRKKQPSSFGGKLVAISRQHPFASGASVFGAVTIAVMASIFYARPAIDTNPLYSTLNLKDGLVTFYNTKDQPILVTPWRVINTADTATNAEFVKRQILITHPLGSRFNVIITSMKLGKRAWDSGPSTTRFLNGEGEELLSLPRPAGELSFRGRRYDSPMEARIVLISRYAVSDATELLTEYSNGRSPMTIQRSDMRGNILGLFWHFGTLQMDTTRLGADGRQLILVYGLNDVDDYAQMGAAVIGVVDPEQITGVTESSASKGFGYHTSEAELYYLSLPLPDAAMATSTRMMVSYIRRVSPTLFDAFVGGEETGSPTARLLGYNAIFDTSMRVLEIKPNDALIDLHRQLFAEGKITAPLSDNYFRLLAGRTRYWNGRGWSESLTTVHHDEGTAAKPLH